jgi:hypothetical protein
METVSKKFPYFSMTFPGVAICFHAEKGSRPVENVCGAHFEAQPGYDGSKPKIPMMFPGCIHGKEKD